MTRAPIDRVAKRILDHIATNLDFEPAAIARSIGASEEVVRHRLQAMREQGVLRGVDLRVDPQASGGPQYEYLVSGVPTPETDRRAIDRLCGAGGVTRVFAMASAHSVAFTVRGSDPAQTQARAVELARSAGLQQVQAVMIVNTFRDRTGYLPTA
jgi:DNA-binding Lrp family transcriptional regulator